MPKKDDTCKGLTFSDCELAILRQAVDEAEEIQGKKVANSPEVKRIIGIVENFIRRKGLIIYGGESINRLMPKQDQFYNRDLEIPDLDMYSSTALNDAKELVDIYIKEGFQEVEAKSGQHHGTYKVYVNFIPVADITYMPKELFNALKKDAVRVGGILCSPPNLLRMGMYLELSRPMGNVERWEKVLKRLTLLNIYYPMYNKECGVEIIQRIFNATTSKKEKTPLELKEERKFEGDIFDATLESLYTGGTIIELALSNAPCAKFVELFMLVFCVILTPCNKTISFEFVFAVFLEYWSICVSLIIVFA